MGPDAPLEHWKHRLWHLGQSSKAGSVVEKAPDVNALELEVIDLDCVPTMVEAMMCNYGAEAHFVAPLKRDLLARAHLPNAYDVFRHSSDMMGDNKSMISLPVHQKSPKDYLAIMIYLTNN